MRLRALTVPVVVGALLANTPQLALGQTDEKADAGGGLTLHADYRPDTRIEAGDLGRFLTENVSLNFGTDMRPLSVKLQVVLLSREKGVTAKWESAAVGVEGGETYPCVKYFCRADEMTEALAPGFGDRRKITLGRLVVINHEEQYYVPRECERATHALSITLVSDEGRIVERARGKHICLRVEG